MVLSLSADRIVISTKGQIKYSGNHLAWSHSTLSLNPSKKDRQIADLKYCPLGAIRVGKIHIAASVAARW